jgi:hypothetical protein
MSSEVNKENLDNITSTPTKVNNSMPEITLTTNAENIETEIEADFKTEREDGEILSRSLSYSSSSANTTPNKSPLKKSNNNSNSTKKIEKKSNESKIDEILKLVSKQTSFENLNNKQVNKTNSNAIKPPTIKQIFDSKRPTESNVKSATATYRSNDQKRFDSKKSDYRKPSNHSYKTSTSSSCSKSSSLSSSRSNTDSRSDNKDLKRKREYFDDFMSDDYEFNKKRSNNDEDKRSTYSSSSNINSSKYDRYTSNSSYRRSKQSDRK